MDNPFRYGVIASGAHFTNREKELATLESAMLSGQNVLIISPRRFGKTSLIRKAIERVREQGALVAYVDLFDVPTKDLLVRRLADVIFREMESPGIQVLSAFRRFMNTLSVNPTISIGEGGTPKLEFPPAARRDGDLDADLRRLFELPQAIAERRRKRVVLVIDEFQEVVGIDPALPAMMRSIFQQQSDVAHVYLGSRHHLMQQTFFGKNQPLYRSAMPVPLNPISSHDFGIFIRERFESAGMSISDAAVDRILALTGGHPNDTQELCYFTWEEARASGSNPGTGAVDKGIEQILAAENGQFTEIWDSLSRTQRILILALAKEPSKALAEDYRLRHHLPSTATIQSARNRLKERELVALDREGNYGVVEVFFRIWLSRRGA